MAKLFQRCLASSTALPLAAGLSLAVFLGAQAIARGQDLFFLDGKRAAKLVMKRERPVYPSVAKLNYIQGVVHVQVVVAKDGHVREAHVVRGHPFLAAASLKAIRGWLFYPAKARAGPPEFQTVMDVRFSLRIKKLEQLPLRPEQDLTRQVRPPEVLKRSGRSSTATLVRLRVLVSPEGQAIDARPVADNTPLLEEARQIVRGWTFRPAHWGTLAVPWYLDVDVPVEPWPPGQTAADPDSR
jgi:TonB family protein